jgi:hypothetical protein
MGPVEDPLSRCRGSVLLSRAGDPDSFVPETVKRFDISLSDLTFELLLSHRSSTSLLVSVSFIPPFFGAPNNINGTRDEA